ncbi:ankyrin repeat domain-containing protein 33B [Dunckerocampus dactyliophorus]|uniref:ankyrin repeat domain-containing protein 33B n=1 Tax=Dunckerocampus dactyliophorus TaxID=161453 RepID=UPI002405742E|nr:ankyrin repeat domain-containing protein 33B [Dunckerocampus dactyliophorus]XP_054621039.1 ankyrin repeat domain-containing protein 33B [Dunckerocampus dactyliophorus]
MVLITDDRDAGVASSLRGKQQQQKAGGDIAHVHPSIAEEDPDEDYLGSCQEDEDGEEEDDFEEVDFEDLDDTRSITSDDSFYPPDDTFADSERTPSPESPKPMSFFRACCSNNATIVRTMIRHGLTEDEVKQTDRNNKTGLLVACYQGYVDVVIALSQCPYLDANWQDSEGNTALITAAQAGHITITNYLLNYYSGLDIERRNCHGFTALMKAAMQGRVECVRALMMAGATLNARDCGRQMTAREWAMFTGRYETAWVMGRLMERPCPRQINNAYSLEWPSLASLVANAQEPRGCLKRLSDMVRDIFNIANVTNPEDSGVIDHLVSVTTAIRSPFIAVTCRTVCPDSPPSVGKRRYAVAEIIRYQRAKELSAINTDRVDTHLKLFQNSRVTLVPKPASDRRASLQMQSAVPRTRSSSLGMLSYNGAELRRTSLLPLHMVLRRSSIRPGWTIPKVRVSKAPTPTYEPEKVRRKTSTKDGGGRHLLQIPKWRYKELKEERRKAEDAERRRLEAITKRHLSVRNRK